MASIANTQGHEAALTILSLPFKVAPSPFTVEPFAASSTSSFVSLWKTVQAWEHTYSARKIEDGSEAAAVFNRKTEIGSNVASNLEDCLRQHISYLTSGGSRDGGWNTILVCKHKTVQGIAAVSLVNIIPKEPIQIEWLLANPDGPKRAGSAVSTT